MGKSGMLGDMHCSPFGSKKPRRISRWLEGASSALCSCGARESAAFIPGVRRAKFRSDGMARFFDCLLKRGDRSGACKDAFAFARDGVLFQPSAEGGKAHIHPLAHERIENAEENVVGAAKAFMDERAGMAAP